MKMRHLYPKYISFKILLLLLTEQLVVSYCLAKNVPKPGEDCYQGMCWCSQGMADCSGNDGRLQFVPVLPPIITSLNFSFNNLYHLHSDFFRNVTHLSFIDLAGNGLVSIDQHAFNGLQNLTNITLDSNFLDFKSLRPVLNVSTLMQLHLRNIRNITFIPENIFIEFPLPNLRQLVLAGSNLADLYLSPFKHLKNLTYLDVGNSRVYKLYVDTLPSLRYLVLNANRIAGDFITTCSANNTSLFPNLDYLSLSSNSISSINGFSVCLPNVSILYLDSNKLRFLKEETFSKFPKLHALKLVRMHSFISYIDPRAFANPSLEYLYLSDNSILFSHKTVSAKMLAGCPRLKFLQLDNNNFANVTDEKFQELFQGLPVLRTVYLGINKITNITSSTFKGLPHVEKLNLYSNAIKDIPDGVFDHLVNLTSLRLDDNHLSEIRETTFNATTRQRLTLLDLSGNPYTCTCSLRWFRAWLIDEAWKFTNFPKGYVCASFSSSSSEQAVKTTFQRNVTKYIEESDDHRKWNSNDLARMQGLLSSRSFQKISNNQQYYPALPDLNYSCCHDLDGNVSLPTVYTKVYLSDFFLSDQACLLSQSTSLLTAVLAGVLVLFMLTFLVLYKYRWHIRLALYEAFRGNPRRRQPERKYEYDVFVSYANEDLDWVRQELIPTLEGRHGLSLCIHQRDFPVGGNIIDNITTSVHSSKRVLFVLSPHFARSRWCQFELVFCQNYAMERDDVIVLTLLAPISGRDMTDAISAMFKTTTYLAWGEEADARNAFWGRLAMAFQDIVPQQMA